MNSIRARAVLWCAAPLLAACSFSEVKGARTCTPQTAPSACGLEEECYRGFCVKKPKTDAETTTDPSTNPKDAALVDARPPMEAGPMSPADAASDTGMMTVLPDVECTDDYTRGCRLPASDVPAADSCRAGEQRCVNGRFGPCVREVNTTDETCNDIDDDCDGRVDEQTEEVCYPNGQTGCIATDYAWVCRGICNPGRRVCRDGALQPCADAIVPVPEVCTGDGTATDESCDGTIDEGCKCSGSGSRACYAGPIGTADIGRCRSGSLRCDDGTLTPCTGSIVPQSESCANEGGDDDCDGTDDDITDRGADCIVSANFGPCRSGTLQCRNGEPALICVTPSPNPETCNGIDDDCNGRIDETFDFKTDPQHCGDCATSCGDGELCCSGRCVNPNSDPANCGGCGPERACGIGGVCCSGRCADLASDTAHCGTCQRSCDKGQSCCSSSCVDTNSDVDNCGRCGNPCRDGQRACCSGQCADLSSDSNCGGCGLDCQARGGSECHCVQDETVFFCKGGECR